MTGLPGTSSRIEPLTSASRIATPTPCVDCVFWQEPRTLSSERKKRRWVEHIERLGAIAWGRIARDGDQMRGVIQYGPSELFPRSQRLAAGPASPDAALLTCMLVFGDDPVGIGEGLVLESLADLKGQGLLAVEAFAIGFSDEVDDADRIRSHHTLFDREFLESLGFEPLRTHGQVALMRLELDGVSPPQLPFWARMRLRARRAALRRAGGG